MHLPDINFWLALAIESHQHHSAASAWFNAAGRQSCCFCRVTQMGFLRLANNKKIFPSDAVPMREAWTIFEEMLSDHRVVFADEPGDVEPMWRRMTQGSRLDCDRSRRRTGPDSLNRPRW
jgi:toxin-antitoxin system PIN domain toxin